MPCNCPEVFDNHEWLPQCESMRAGSSWSAKGEGLEPTSCRCPRCAGPIVRIYFEKVKLDPITDEFLPPDQPGEPVLRAAYRCRSRACGWAEWVLWIGIQAELELDDY